MESSYIVAGIIANVIAIARSYIGIKVRLQVRKIDEERATKILEPSLRAKAKDIPDYPALWKEPPPPKPPRVRKGRKQHRKWVGPLVGDGNWFEDPVRKKYLVN